jgi:hypothetical protein
MSTYCSTDRNITIRFIAQPSRPPDDKVEGAQEVRVDFAWADVSIIHPFLVRLCYNGAKDTSHDDYTLYSKITNAPVVTLKQPDGQAIALVRSLPKCLARIERGVRPLEEVLRTGTEVSTAFRIAVPSHADNVLDRRKSSAASTDGKLVPQVQQVLDEAVHQRRQEMQAEITAFMRRQQDALETFIAHATEEAEVLSEIASLGSLKEQQKPGDERRTTITQKKSAIKQAKENLPSTGGTVSQSQAVHVESDCTTGEQLSSGRPRRGSDKSATKPHRQRVPYRRETVPLPKSVLVKEVRRKSSMSHLSDGSSRCSDQTSPVIPKRVMFSEQEPQRIDSPTLSSDAEDDNRILTASQRLQISTTPDEDDLDVEDVFDMDETIPVVPLPARHKEVQDSPGLSDLPNSRIYGRQSDSGLSGSFKLRSMDKYSPPGREDEGDEVPSLVPPEARQRRASLEALEDVAPSAFATSLPRDVPASMQATHSPAIINSVKDLTGISPERAEPNASPSDGSPPAGVSREVAWRRAVQSSMRMSGLLMPKQVAEDVERAVQQALSKDAAKA